jgi:hypothetical protein
LQPPDSSVAARQQGEFVAQQVRQEVGNSLGDSLDETMNDLRGRTWSS